MNPTKHRLIENPVDYPFCSHKWFIEHGDEKLKEQVFAQPTDRVNVFDDF